MKCDSVCGRERSRSIVPWPLRERRGVSGRRCWKTSDRLRSKWMKLAWSTHWTWCCRCWRAAWKLPSGPVSLRAWIESRQEHWVPPSWMMLRGLLPFQKILFRHESVLPCHCSVPWSHSKLPLRGLAWWAGRTHYSGHQHSPRGWGTPHSVDETQHPPH